MWVAVDVAIVFPTRLLNCTDADGNAVCVVDETQPNVTILIIRFMVVMCAGEKIPDLMIPAAILANK